MYTFCIFIVQLLCTVQKFNLQFEKFLSYQITSLISKFRKKTKKKPSSFILRFFNEQNELEKSYTESYRIIPDFFFLSVSILLDCIFFFSRHLDFLQIQEQFLIDQIRIKEGRLHLLKFLLSLCFLCILPSHHQIFLTA